MIRPNMDASLTDLNSYIISGQLFHTFSEFQLTAEQLKGKGPKLKCNFCDKVFSKNFDLQQHIRR